ncbi:mannitol dehydrogenase family protein [Falsihalocynthiibacter sp. SS001]|uniref:mannitol dehydrogenase family protein n=1 Tax=Falsihalocynthiibacter sp. SS001 TaxID=3349698 RepID=UPI0036D20B83
MSERVKTPIFQFGTSRFLQAHADLFIAEALAKNEAAGRVAVVKTTDGSARADRLVGLTQEGGYPVRILGLENGQPVDRTQHVTSVAKTFSTSENWSELVEQFVSDAEYVISNTGDKGYAAQPADGGPDFDQAMSFPAKLEQLLFARFEANARALTILPMELIVKNGAVLKARVLEIALKRSPEFRNWLDADVMWLDSLVDRIVSEPIEPAGAIAEPYALWAIERLDGFVPPVRHPCVKIVESLEVSEALKLFILNLGHTYLADRWLTETSPPALVREYLDDTPALADLKDLYAVEVLPAFAAAGLQEQAETYVATTLDRFRNPFLDHKIQDIAGNHNEKIQRRIGDFIAWAHSKGCTAPKPRLAKIVKKSEDKEHV